MPCLCAPVKLVDSQIAHILTDGIGSGMLSIKRVMEKIRQLSKAAVKPGASEHDTNTRLVAAAGEELIPAFAREHGVPAGQLRAMLRRAVGDWLTKSPSVNTREAYERDVGQFLQSLGVDPEAL